MTAKEYSVDASKYKGKKKSRDFILEKEHCFF